MNDLALGTDGSLYFAQSNSISGNSNDRVRVIGTDGMVSTVPGIPTGFAGGVTAAPDGTIFYVLGDGTGLAGGTIYRIATDGTVTTAYANPDKWLSTVAAISSTASPPGTCVPGTMTPTSRSRPCANPELGP